MNQLQYQPNQPIINQAPPINPPNYVPQQNLGLMSVQYPIGSEVRSPLLVNQILNLSLKAVECLDDLNGSSETIIIKYFEGLIFRDIKYEVSIKYKDGVTRIIFFGKKTGTFLDKDSFSIKVKYIPRDFDLTKIISDKKFDERFLYVATVSEFLKGCSKPKVQVINVENRTLEVFSSQIYVVVQTQIFNK